jgi:hypothetical protein
MVVAILLQTNKVGLE